MATPATNAFESRDLGDVLQRVSLAVASGSGDIFHELVRGAAEALGTDFAFIGETVAGQPDVVNMRALYSHGKFEPSFFYSLELTPCRSVINQVFRYYPTNVQQIFNDPHLKEIGADGYAAIPLYDSGGTGIGLMGVMHRAPLTEESLIKAVLRILSVRAAAELERRNAVRDKEHSDVSYRSLFESTEDAVFVVDIQTGSILDANRTACDRYGYARSQLTSMAVKDLCTGDAPYTPALAMEYIAVAATGEPINFEWHARNSDGSVRWDEVRLRHTKIGGVNRILAFTRDITDRKQREEALRKSEDRLRAAIDAALDCVIVINAKGEIVEFNPAAEETFGHRKTNVLGRSLAELMIPERFREGHIRGMENHLRSGDGQYLGRRVEVVAMRANGEEFPAELAIDSAQGADGKIFIGYLRDITARKRAEAERERLESQLRQSQKMEAIGQLTGGIAHDFNNILTGVMGYIVMAQERSLVTQDESSAKYLDRAQRAVQRARDLIQQMLTYSRGQQGSARPNDLVVLARESMKLLESSLPSTVEIHTNFQNKLPLVRVDPVQFEQVLMNLCINARDAMDGHGRLDIELYHHECPECVCTSCRKSFQGSQIVLTVSDTGSGISQDALDRIFEPFFTTKEVGKGSGMGLAMVHGIVHEYGGHVVVENRRDHGVRFHIMFPLAVQSAPARTEVTSPAALPVKAILKGRVLLVDDDATAREFMHDRLSDWGMQVASFESPESALAHFEIHPQEFDLAILDQTMPRMTGIELAHRLTVSRPDLPKLLYTGYGEAGLEKQLQSAGIHAVLRKPVNEPELLERLRELL